ncbi:glycosyl hydrolase [Chitinophaga tropicalis]|uniref:Glycoside hydrolase n=1 Tax=Chitinophaga tropicalis TaxID=2683588 RepID=A0A7K1U6Y7_9BACT|nr:glycosyl hydrolase [Chitinophaga tropicalis]MVT10123.1 glycoside hydrolase [Chitinophaga tropicalis]
MRNICLTACFLVLSCFRGFAQQSASSISSETFAHPSASSGIRCWWWWLNGNVTKASITRDLEAMKDKGFSGACIFDAGGYDQWGNGPVPEGPLFGSPAWKELYLHAVKEASRLGLVLSLNIQSGWNLGAPDVQPQEAAKHITWSETVVNSNGQINQQLTLPPIRKNFYRDIVVLALPWHDTTGITPLNNLLQKAAFNEVGGSATDTRFLLSNAHKENSAAQELYSTHKQTTSAVISTVSDGRAHAAHREVLDISRFMDSTGMLKWNAPAGKWVVLRLGYTYNGAHISTSSGKWQGLVIDPMNTQHFTRYWNTHVKPLLELIGPEAGKTLRYLQTDSWELGGVNWTENFREEFRRRRGYDLLPYLPVIAGKIIDNTTTSDNFLNDFRKTVSDCIAENHYRIFQQKAAAYGMGIQPESGGPHAGPFDGIKNLGYSEIMMGEFWSPSAHRPVAASRFFVKQASSAAHIYNKPLVGAEAFTTIGRHWNDVIWEHMKPSFDHEVCAGLNLTLLHTFTASPKEMGLPGQEYFAGTHFNPNITWWKYADAFFTYMARVQYMMQQGDFVADVLYYYGDHVPNVARLKEDDPAGALPGYDYDVINEDRLLLLGVKDGWLTLPHGMRYRVMVLPDHRVLSLTALKRINALVIAGATIIGNRPVTTASLVGGAGAEKEALRLAGKLWGTMQTAKGSHTVGKGQIAWGYTAAEWLLKSGTPEDCTVKTDSVTYAFPYIHHRKDSIDYYYVSNQQPVATQATFTFRVSGKQPELWDPVTGQTRKALAFTQQSGLTTIPVPFSPYGSWLVVFREKILPSQQGIAANNTPVLLPVDTLNETWQVRFDTAWGGPAQAAFPRLTSWTERPESEIRYYSGSAVYKTTFSFSGAADDKLMLDLGAVKDVGIAHVTLNGHDQGVVWAPPLRVPVSGILKTGENTLEIEVINSWRNRLVGDRDRPVEKRFTRTNITIRPEWELLPSGLLGPVTILREQP